MEWSKKLNNRLLGVLVSPRSFLVFGILLLLYNVLGVAFVRCLGESDYWEHLAAIASFERSPLQPANPYLLTDSPTHLLTPYHFFWGLFSRTFSIAPFHIFPIVAAVNTLLFLAAVRVFCARIFGDAKWSLALSLTMLFWWINGWPWSGFYFFGLFPSAAVYPYWFALPAALGLIALFEPTRGFGHAMLCGIGVVLVFLVHPITGGFLMLSLAVKLFFAQEVSRSHSIGILILHCAIYAIGIVMWPFFPVLESILRAPGYSAITFAGDWRMFYDKAVLRIAPSLVGAYWLIKHWRESRMKFLVVVGATCTALYVTNFIVLHSATLSRLVIFIALIGHFGVVAALAANSDRSRGRPFVIAFIAATVLLAFPQFLQSSKEIAPLYDLRQGAPVGTHSNVALFDLYTKMGRKIEPGAVVLAPLDESWYLPGIVDCKVVGVHHSNPFLNDFEERKRATLDFFDPAIADADRWAIVDRFKVQYVLVPETKEVDLRTLKSSLELLSETTSLRLYRVKDVPSRRPLAPH